MDSDDAMTRMSPACIATSGRSMRLAYPAPPRGSHKGVPLRCAFGVPRAVLRHGAIGAGTHH